MRVAQADPAEWIARPVGALVGGAGVPVLLVVLGWLEPRARPDALLERPDLAALAVIAAGTAGFGAGRLVASAPRLAVAWIGAFAAAAALTLFMTEFTSSAFVSELLRGAASTEDAAAPVAWALYGLAVVLFVLAVPLVVTGTTWAIITRLVVRLVKPRVMTSKPPLRHARLALAVAFVVPVVVAGAVDAGLRRPGGTVCLALGGERPVAGAWSPDGSLIAIASTKDPNEQGHVRVLRWPSRELVAQWSGWVDQSVAVDDSGHAYWSAWVLGPWPMDADAGTSGIYSAAPGKEPHWLTSDAGHGGAEVTLGSMSWTRDGLVGMTANSHVIATAPFGRPEPVDLVRPDRRSVGGVWASPDGSWVLTSRERFSPLLRIEHGDNVDELEIPDDPRGLAMTPNRRGIVVASWFGGTRIIDVKTGGSRLLLTGNQAWIAVSSTGNLAWSDDETYGPGITCVVRLPTGS